MFDCSNLSQCITGTEYIFLFTNIQNSTRKHKITVKLGYNEFERHKMQPNISKLDVLDKQTAFMVYPSVLKTTSYKSQFQYLNYIDKRRPNLTFVWRLQP